MGTAFLIGIREGLEAALIVGIVLGMIRRTGKGQHRRAVWLGVAAAVVVSLVAAVILNALGIALAGRGEQIFEGMTMLLAAVLLSWMILWLRREGQRIQEGLRADVQRALSSGRGGALFALSFVAVAREGIETALFLSAASFTGSALSARLGALLGLTVAAGLGWGLFASSLRLNLRLFFRISGVLLLLFAAGLVARGIHELQEGGALPVFVEHLWDTNPLLDETGPAGSFLRTLLGYNGDPSLLEVVSYGIYAITISAISIGLSRREGRAGAPPDTGSSARFSSAGGPCDELKNVVQ